MLKTWTPLDGFSRISHENEKNSSSGAKIRIQIRSSESEKQQIQEIP